MIAEHWLDGAQLVMANREFHSYSGTYKDVPVSVISTGLGSPGATMVIQDLPRLGVKTAIRVGTAGSATERVKPGDVVIATAAVRDEGVSHQMIPANYPAVADYAVCNTLHEAAASLGVKVHSGIVHTSDAFTSPNLAAVQKQYSEANILAFEMEAAAVMVMAALNNTPLGCILSIDGYVKNVAAGDTAPDAEARDKGIQKAISIALEAMVSHTHQNA
jgi:uridine phosphorylase